MAAFRIHCYSSSGKLTHDESGAPMALIRLGYKRLRAGRCDSFMVFEPPLGRSGTAWHGRRKDLEMSPAEIARHMRHWRKQTGLRWRHAHVTRYSPSSRTSLRGEEHLAMERQATAAHREQQLRLMESRIGTRRHGSKSRQLHADSRTGIPMYKPRQYGRVYVLVEHPDGRTEYRWWRGSSAKSIRDAAKKAYPDCKLRFGKITYHVH